MQSTISAMADLHRQDLLREAERNRLVKIARDAGSPVHSAQTAFGSPIARLRQAVSRWAVGATSGAFSR
jgi:hypothetical protein